MHSPVKVWRNQKRLRKLLRRQGKIMTWTMIHVPPQGFSAFAPYPIAVVELENGERITAQVVDYTDESLKTGTPVVTVLRRVRELSADSVIPYGIKVKPIQKSVEVSQ